MQRLKGIHKLCAHGFSKKNNYARFRVTDRMNEWVREGTISRQWITLSQEDQVIRLLCAFTLKRVISEGNEGNKGYADFCTSYLP